MDSLAASRFTLLFATLVFTVWTSLVLSWLPKDNYADLAHAYAENTNLIARGMSIGIACYLAVIASIIGWNVTKRQHA